MKKSFLCVALTLLLIGTGVLSGCEHTHAFGEWTVTKEATCTVCGEKQRTCSCGETQTQPIRPQGHNYDRTVLKDATCTENGEEQYVCKVCGWEETETVAALGHSFGSWSQTKAPTCAAAGTNTRTCVTCGAKDTQAIPATGHDWKDATCTTPKTCRVCSAKSGSALGHSYSSSGKCTRCGEQRLPEIRLYDQNGTRILTGGSVDVTEWVGTTSRRGGRLSNIRADFDNRGNIVLSFDAEKTFDTYGATCTWDVWFTVKVYDPNGGLLHVDGSYFSNLKSGEKILNRSFKIYSSYISGTMNQPYIKIVIEDYYF